MKKLWENQFSHGFFNVSMKKWWENLCNTKHSILFLCEKAFYYMGIPFEITNREILASRYCKKNLGSKFVVHFHFCYPQKEKT